MTECIRQQLLLDGRGSASDDADPPMQYITGEPCIQSVAKISGTFLYGVNFTLI